MKDSSIESDVIVAGGGMAGVAAAVASARCGARTTLIEKHGCPGGAATIRNVLTLCGLYTLADEPVRIVHGIADEVTSELAKRSAITEPQKFRGVFVAFDPEAMKVVLDRLLVEAGVDVRLGSFITGASRDAGQLQSLTFTDHGGKTLCNAKAFIDCTGDGDLAYLGGASTRYGNNGQANLGTLGTRFGGIAPETAVTVDDVIAAIASLDLPEGSVSKDRCVTVRVPVSQDLVLYLASADYDPLDALSLTNAEINTRKQAWHYLDAIRGIPGCENAYLASSGPEIGTRESRHLDCQCTFSWDDIKSRRTFADTIALGGWGAEWHDRQSYVSSFDYAPEKGAYEIPLGCLHSVDTQNLFCAGRLADGDRKAGAAIRVMGTAMATGQAAGIAAALTADQRFTVANVQSGLRAQGAMF